MADVFQMSFGLVYVCIAVAGVLFAASYVYILVRKIMINRRRRKKFSGNYYDPDNSEISAGRILDISDYWQAKCEHEAPEYYIDAITWDDLDMDMVFKKMNACQSSPGEEVLYSKLHQPVFDRDELNGFSAAVSFFENSEEDRLKVLSILDGLGKDSHLSSKLLYGVEEKSLKHSWVYYILGALPLISLLSMIFIEWGLVFLLITITVNVGVYLYNKPNINVYTDTVKYLLRITKAAKVLSRLNLGNSDYNSRLIEALGRIGKFKIIGTVLKINDEREWGELGYVFALIKILFLLDFISYSSIIRLLVDKHDGFKDVYETVGEIDCAIAVDAYKRTLPYCSRPEFTESEEIEFDGLYHPLLDNPVANSLCWTNNCIITGSNASGKSTFIKAVAISLICAQSIGLTFAREFRGKMCLVITSMAVRDQITTGDSYFIIELKCLRRMLYTIGEDVRLICFVDEILRGTNTSERISAAASVLHWLDGQNCRVMAASHDIELTEILSGVYDNYHFRERISNGEMVFDFTIYPGPANTKNAISLMEQMDFDANIISSARTMSDVFEKDRSWHL